jgi:SAM-dependent methyltransferase
MTGPTGETGGASPGSAPPVSRVPSGEPPRDAGAAAEPWQLRLFSKTLKKQQKLRLLLSQLGEARDLDCLLVTNGDNNGALNWHFRDHGGRWTWVENERDHVDEMQQLLGETVLLGEPERIPAPDASFDAVISIDVHEHLQDCVPFSRELARVTRPGGRVIVTTPNGGALRPVTVLKHLVGMTPERYGHVVVGYDVRQHEAMLRQAGLEPTGHGSYSHFFTELLELAVNFAYVMVLARRGKVRAREGEIAPASRDQLRAVEKQYRLYRLAWPVLLAISRLDVLLSFLTGYAVSVVARKPETSARSGPHE